MTGDAEPLQGNLFGTEANDSAETVQSEIHGPNQKANLSDLELSEDAKKRPRTRNDLETKKREGTKKQKIRDLSTDDDLPWSNHKMVDQAQLTPMLCHYVELKKANPERLLLYRLGDFYECFFEDAIYISRVLELTLTGKEGGKSVGRVPMAGIPHHAAEKYCTDLIRQGKSIALCDQLETKPSKGLLIRRDITRVITPGTVIEEGMLAARKNNWLAALIIEETRKSEDQFSWGLASADVSTGEFTLKQRSGLAALKQELSQIDISEIICGDLENLDNKLWCPEQLYITKVSSTPFNQIEAEVLLKKYYKISTLDGLGLQEFPLSLRAAGGLLSYLQETTPLQEQDIKLNIEVPLLDIPRMNFSNDFLILDSQTRRNLEITTTQRDNLFQGSLLWAIDRTLTAMGGRCLRRWIEAPLMDPKLISNRQLLISLLVKERSIRKELRRLLRPMGDLERIAGRAGAGHASGRDLVAIADGLERLPKLSKSISGLLDPNKNFLKKIIEIDTDLIEITKTIRFQLIENPPLSLNEGGLIHDGVDPILDGLRNQLDDQEKWLASQEDLERKISKNPNLRLQYHRTFGYFLAVSKARANKVPDHWIRRQTLANEERFITPDLKAREGKIFQLKARVAQREYELFCNLRKIVGKETNKIRQTARDIASLDAMAGLAELAATEDYCRPEILTKDEGNISMEVVQSRHPVVEQLIVDENFTPNDIHLNKQTEVIILTGPNASGKSCFLRQIGLIQLLAQIGSWVPAQKAKVALVDRIFTRVGAVDDLAAGQSTFIVEMAETANILNNATKQSLVLLDEIGRGTSTFDGLAIAWSVSEYIAKNLHSKTVFATHYHELNSLANHLDNVANYQVMVKETGDELLFLHRVSKGGASQSYGIEAARLAGVPTDVLNRAREVLKKLEADQKEQKIATKAVEK